MTSLQQRLKEVIAAFGVNQPVIIAPDPEARHERVIRVMDACSYGGVQKLAFRYPLASTNPNL